MAVMIVGADNLGNIEKNLRDYGINSIEHLTCRNASARKKFSIPNAISLIVVFIDFVNHATARNLKEQAKSQGIPTIFAKRSWCSLEEQLVKQGFSRSEACADCIKKAESRDCPRLLA